MQTLRSFAERLASADTLDSLAGLAASIGCDGTPAQLDAETRRSLGLEPDVADARIAAGAGALRALVLDLASHDPIREVVVRVAGRLSTRAPHVLWVLLASQRQTRSLAIAAWSDDRRPVRVAAIALVATRCVALLD